MDVLGKLPGALGIIGHVVTFAAFLALVAGVVAWIRGVLPAVLRLGSGLAHSKIAVLAKGDHMTSLMALLEDSKLFRRRNLITVTSAADIGRAKGAAVYLVNWPDWQDQIDQVLSSRPDGSALVVYAPPDSGSIPSDRMHEIGNSRNAIVTNFRGRLLNDLLISMITGSSE